jgi:hypothetical protein
MDINNPQLFNHIIDTSGTDCQLVEMTLATLGASTKEAVGLIPQKLSNSNTFPNYHIMETNGTVNYPKIIPIGDWDMDANDRVSVSHGLGINWHKVLSIFVMILDDGNNIYTPLNMYDSVHNDWLPSGAIYDLNDTFIIPIRRSGSGYDSTEYNLVPHNRGYIYIWLFL